MTTAETTTIYLTARPPVTVRNDAWPIIAHAREYDYDGQYEFQAICRTWWHVRTRQHADGRAIVYASYRHEDERDGKKNYAVYTGVMLPAGSTASDVCDAIRRVCYQISEREHCGDDAKRWVDMVDLCVSDMPAEVLD